MLTRRAAVEKRPTATLGHVVQRKPVASAGRGANNAVVRGDASYDDLRVPAEVPTVFVVTGSSMAPGLRPGWQLRVVPLDGAPAAGDVVVLRSGAGLHGAAAGMRRDDNAGARESVGIPVTAGGASSRAPRVDAELVTPAYVVHRIVWIGHVGERRIVFHRGDAGGRVGLTDSDAVVARVVGVLTPATSTAGEPEPPVPSLDALDAARRSAFRRAQRRCRAYVALRRTAARFGLARAHEGTLVARAAALVRRRLLRT